MATELFAPSVPVTLGLSLSRSRTQDYLAQRNDKDINGKDDRWDGNMDQDAQGRLFPRPRRRSSKGYVSIPEGKVAEKDEWELAEEVGNARLENARSLRSITRCPPRSGSIEDTSRNAVSRSENSVCSGTISTFAAKVRMPCYTIPYCRNMTYSIEGPRRKKKSSSKTTLVWSSREKCYLSLLDQVAVRQPSFAF